MPIIRILIVILVVSIGDAEPIDIHLVFKSDLTIHVLAPLNSMYATTAFLINFSVFVDIEYIDTLTPIYCVGKSTRATCNFGVLNNSVLSISMRSTILGIYVST